MDYRRRRSMYTTHPKMWQQPLIIFVQPLHAQGHGDSRKWQSQNEPSGLQNLFYSNFFSQTVHSHLVDSCSKTRKKVLIIIKISYFVHSHGSTTAPSDTQLKCICIPSRDIRSICSNFYWLWMTSSIKFIEFCQFRFRMRLVIKKSYFKYKRQI